MVRPRRRGEHRVHSGRSRTRRAVVTSSSDGTLLEAPMSGAHSAVVLRNDPARVAQARRLRPRDGDRAALDRLAALAAHLLGTAAGQVSLLEDVQIVAGGAGLPDG